MSGFIKDKDLLEENHKIQDLLNFSNEVDRLYDLVEQALHSSMVGYVGKFGSGKSTTLFQLQKRYEEDKSVKWFEFDAWKYPERKDLWEGFVLDIADQLGGKEKTKKELDGNGPQNKTIGAVAGIAQSLSLVSAGVSSIVSNLLKVFEKQPIERVFEIQDLLTSIFREIEEKTIFIVVEDIDRSGDAGVYFLETLRQFIKNNTLDKKVIVLVPIGEQVFNESPRHRDSYRKVLDYIEYFEVQNIKFSNFVDAVFDPEAFGYSGDVVVMGEQTPLWEKYLLDWFRLSTEQNLTIREIKSIIRHANASFITLINLGYTPNPHIVMSMQLLNFIKTEGGKRWIQNVNSSKPIRESCPVMEHLIAIGNSISPEDFSRSGYFKYPIRFVEDDNISIPELRRGNPLDKEDIYVLGDFYLLPFGRKK